MSDHAWEELLDVIDQKYGIISHQNHTAKLDDNNALEEKVTEVTFERDDQEYKFTRAIRPRIIDKKTYYHRSGGAQRVENVYDPEETSSKVVLYKKSAGEWLEIEPDGIF